MLRTAAILNFILATGHIICMPWLDEAFRLYGIEGIMNDVASYGRILPYLITTIIAGCFALCGVYALSAAGGIRELPFLRTGIFFIAVVFLFRAATGCFEMLSAWKFPFIDISSVIVSGGIGLLYLTGGIKKYRILNR